MFSSKQWLVRSVPESRPDKPAGMARFIVLCSFVAHALAGPVLETTQGTIHGVYQRILGVDIEAYLGIPYMVPVVDIDRYTKPRYHGFFKDRTLNATKRPPDCPQPPLVDGKLKPSQSEDCLYLNIFRQRGTDTNDFKAVLVVIHGGGFYLGSSSAVYQSAEALVAVGDVILVSFNYRLGILGFPNFKSFAPGNLGLFDQQMALRWIRDNISDYGGDPEEVTLMGTSTGSMSIAAHLVSQDQKEKHFRSVIMDGGVLTSNMLLEDVTTSYRRINKVAHELGCTLNSVDMVECLQDTEIHHLIEISSWFGTDNGLTNFAPTADDKFIPSRTEEFVEEKNVLMPKVRMMIGYALDEGTAFLGSRTTPFDFTAPTTRDELIAYMNKLAFSFNFPLDLRDKVARNKTETLYLDENPRCSYCAVADFVGDGGLKCPTNRFIKSYAKVNDQVYVYQFERKLRRAYLPSYDPDYIGVFHASPYVHFAGPLFLFEPKIDPVDREFMFDAMKMITDFVNTRDGPSFRGQPWPKYSETGQILIINDTISLRTGLPNDHKCGQLFTSPYEYGKIWVKTEL